MAKVWMVSKGEYSDYSVVGIFSTKEKAEEYIQEASKDESGNRHTTEFHDPEEIELDAEVGKQWLDCHGARVTMKEQQRWKRGKEEPGDIETFGLTYKKFIRPDECVVEGMVPNTWAIVVYSPVSLSHAIKVAVEKRQEWLRSQESPVPVGPEQAGHDGGHAGGRGVGELVRAVAEAAFDDAGPGPDR